MDINHANIFYVRDIHRIGGVETFVYELAKKYKDYDIAVVCKNVAPEQAKRLKKFCKVYIHTNQKINCKVIITNWDTSIYDYVNEDAKKYTVLHTDYSNPTEYLGLPEDRPDITYIGITESSKKAFEDITKIDRTILCRNPYELEEDEPLLVLLSATRLTDIKDGGRFYTLANTLQELGINFIWYIVTTDEYEDNPVWTNKNVVHIPNRLDVGSLMKKADWYVQLSICEGDSYSLKEALYRGLPIVVCDLPYFKEIGIEDGVNALFYNSDNSNTKEIAEKMKKPLKFKFNKVQDGYNELLDKTKSHYEEEKNMRYKVRATNKYKQIAFIDNELNHIPEPGEEWEVDFSRLQLLQANGYVTLVEEIPEENSKISDKIEIPEISSDIEDIEADKPSIDIKELKKLKKADLIEKAHEYGVEIIDDTLTKDQIIELIQTGVSNE